jgi:hypothetical protein
VSIFPVGCLQRVSWFGSEFSSVWLFFCCCSPYSSLVYLRFPSSQKVSVHIINSHHNNLITHKDPLDCPCGRCPAGGFNLIELYNHLIESHSIPMAGLRHKKTSSGALPTLHTLNDLAHQPTKQKSCGVGANSPAPPLAPASPSVSPLSNEFQLNNERFCCRVR